MRTRGCCWLGCSKGRVAVDVDVAVVVDWGSHLGAAAQDSCWCGLSSIHSVAFFFDLLPPKPTIHAGHDGQQLSLQGEDPHTLCGQESLRELLGTGQLMACGTPSWAVGPIRLRESFLPPARVDSVSYTHLTLPTNREV